MRLKSHLVIPDCQIRPGVPLEHLEALGHYIVDRQPDVIVNLGDFADMHSLSSYDMGKRAGEGARYAEDIEAAELGMATLMGPIKEYNSKMRRQKMKQYQPRMELTLGNHEQRIERYVESNPTLDGKVSYGDLPYGHYGWTVRDFLEPVEIDGILYCHYFPRNAQGRIVQTRSGAPNARLQVLRELQSCTSGHLQGLDYYVHQTGKRRYHGIIAGSFYQHEEEYLSPQGTAYWRGVVIKHEVENGQYDPMFVSLNYLLRRYM